MVNRISRDDFKLIAAKLKAAYPKDDFIGSQYTFNLWYTALQDIPYPTLNKAAASYIMSNHFPPAISDIRQLAYDLDAPADEIAAEEWARLMKALGYAGSPEAHDRWENLPPITKEILGGFSEYMAWANTPTMDLMSVQRPMFIKRYEEKSRIIRFRGSVPQPLQKPIRQLTAETVAKLEEKKTTQPAGESVEAPSDMIKKLKERLEHGKAKQN